MEEETEEEKYFERLQLGEILIESTKFDVIELSDIMIKLLKDPSVKNYLCAIEKSTLLKSQNGMVG